MNLLLITIDCLRADHTGCYGYKGNTTPNIDGIAEHGVKFDSAIVSSTPTYFSFPGIMASRYPTNYGRDFIGLTDKEDTLSTIFSKSGYQTAGFNAGNPFCSAQFGYDRGFEKFEDFLSLNMLKNSTKTPQLSSGKKVIKDAVKSLAMTIPVTSRMWEEASFKYNYKRFLEVIDGDIEQCRLFPDAEKITDEFLEWIRQRDSRPFFVWLHYMDAHYPYYPPPEVLAERSFHTPTLEHEVWLNRYWVRDDSLPIEKFKAVRDDIICLYDSNIAWIDKHIGRLKMELEELQIWDETISVITADHGEEMLEHGNRGHMPRKLNQELTNIPLIINDPDEASRYHTNDNFTLLDLPATILGRFGIDSPSAFDGVDRSIPETEGKLDEIKIIETINDCSEPRKRESLLQGRIIAAVKGKYKLIKNIGKDLLELFDKDADPNEFAPLELKEHRAIVKELCEAMIQHLRSQIQKSKPELTLDAKISKLKRELNAG